MGILSSSFFRIKTGELNIVCKKNVSNIDWWEQAIKNFSLVIIFSFPITFIFTDKKIFKQYFVQYPIILPPNNVTDFGKIKLGIKKIDIKIIPRKKKVLNNIFLNI